MLAGMHRLPVLAELGVQHFMNGPESFTPDSRPLLGESPFLNGFFVAAGMNSTGMMSSAGIGKAMAEWLVADEAPMDLWAVDIARFDRASASKSFLIKRVWKKRYPMYLACTGLISKRSAGRKVRQCAIASSFHRSGCCFWSTDRLGASTLVCR